MVRSRLFGGHPVLPLPLQTPPWLSSSAAHMAPIAVSHGHMDNGELDAEIPADLHFRCWTKAWKCPPKSPPCTSRLGGPRSSVAPSPLGLLTSVWCKLALVYWRQSGVARVWPAAPVAVPPPRLMCSEQTQREIRQSELIIKTRLKEVIYILQPAVELPTVLIKNKRGVASLGVRSRQDHICLLHFFFVSHQTSPDGFPGGRGGTLAFQLRSRRTDDLAAPLEVVRTSSPPKSKPWSCTAHPLPAPHGRMLCRGLTRPRSSIMDVRRREKPRVVFSSRYLGCRSTITDAWGCRRGFLHHCMKSRAKWRPEEDLGRFHGPDPQGDCTVWELGLSFQTRCFHQELEKMRSQRLIDT